MAGRPVSRKRVGHEQITLTEGRLKKGYSQQKLANIVNVNVVQYQRLEYGKRSIRNMTMKMGLAICIALDLDPYKMVFGEEFDPKKDLLDIIT